MMATADLTTPKRQPKARRDRKIDRLWLRYRHEPSVELRNRLVEHYLYLAKDAARGFVFNKPLVFEDVFLPACEGLIDAVERFEPERGLAFCTFASPRIRGAMLDHLRKVDYIPRLERARHRHYLQTIERLSATLGRRPTTQEIEDELPADPLVGEVPALFSLEEKIEFDRGGARDCTAKDILPAKRQRLNGEDFSWLAGYLGEDDRTAVYLYFFKDVTMHTIGALLGQCESRISQRVTAALKKLSALKREEAAELSMERESP